MPGQEATLFRLEIVDDSEPLVDEDVAGIGHNSTTWGALMRLRLQ